MKDILKNVLKKIIVSKYSELVDVEISSKVIPEESVYRITYLVDGGIGYDEAYDIIKETESLFKMLDPKDNESVIVNFGRYSEEDSI